MTTSFSTSGDARIGGAVICQTLDAAQASITNAMVKTNADLGVEKMRHRHVITHAQPNTTATAETKAIYVASKAAVVKEVKAGAIAAAIGDSTVTVDVKINGTTVLSSTIGLSSSDTAYVPLDGTINTSADDLTEDQVLTVVITVSAGSGTLPTGVFVSVTIEELGA